MVRTYDIDTSCTRVGVTVLKPGNCPPDAVKGTVPEEIAAGQNVFCIKRVVDFCNEAAQVVVGRRDQRGVRPVWASHVFASAWEGDVSVRARDVRFRPEAQHLGSHAVGGAIRHNVCLDLRRIGDTVERDGADCFPLSFVI